MTYQIQWLETYIYVYIYMCVYIYIHTHTYAAKKENNGLREVMLLQILVKIN